MPIVEAAEVVLKDIGTGREGGRGDRHIMKS